MTEDERCCGTGTCIISPEGVCWCGQVWDGEKMCLPKAMKIEHLEENKKNTPFTAIHHPNRSDSH